MSDKLLEQYNDAQFYRDDVTSFLRMFATRKEWPETREEREAIDPKIRRERAEAELTGVLAEVQQFYANQVRKLHDPSEERTDDEKRYGLLHPVVIADHLLKKFPYDDTQKKDLMEIVRKSFPEDALMGSLPGDKTPGFYDKRSMPALVGFAHLFAKLTPDEPVCLVEGDFTNIKMCNHSKLGRDGTDKLMRAISVLVKEKFEGSGAKEVECVRQGGDELRLVVYGLNRENVNKVLKQQVHPALNRIAAEFGVQEIAHSKGGSPPGFGAAFASVRLDGSPDSDPGKIQNQLEKAMALQKEHDGFLRFGLFNKDDEQRYINEVYKPGRSAVLESELRKRGAPEEAIGPQVERTINAEIAKNEYHWLTQARSAYIDWNRLTSDDGVYRKDFAEYKKSSAYEEDRNKGVSEPQGFFRFIAKEHPGNLDDIKIPARRPIEEAVPFHGQKIFQMKKPGREGGDADGKIEFQMKYEDPEINRLRKAYMHFGFPTLANAPVHLFQFDRGTRKYTRDEMGRIEDKNPDKIRLQRMVTDLMHYFDARDPASLSKTDTLMVEDARDFVRPEQYGSMKVMVVELANLSGLNKLSYNLGSSMLREEHDQIQRSLRMNPGAGGRYTHAADHVYDLKGGVYMVFMPHDYPEADFKGVENHLHKWMEEKSLREGAYLPDKGILGTPVIDFAKVTYAKLTRGLFDKDMIEELRSRLGHMGEKKSPEEEAAAGHAERLGEKPHKTPSQKTFGDIPNPREGGKPLGIEVYYDSRLIGPDDNIEERLKEIKAAALEHFDRSPGRAAPSQAQTLPH